MDPRYVSARNRGVPPARAASSRRCGSDRSRSTCPVVLAPMAGITNPPFRTLCRGFGAGLYVSEMITARALVERNAKTLRLAGFDPSEKPRSLQLYAVDEHYTREAVRWLVGEGLVDHLVSLAGADPRRRAGLARRGEQRQLPGTVLAHQVHHRPPGVGEPLPGLRVGRAVEEVRTQRLVAAVVHLLWGGERLRASTLSRCSRATSTELSRRCPREPGGCDPETVRGGSPSIVPPFAEDTQHTDSTNSSHDK